MQNENERIVIEHQLIVKDDKDTIEFVPGVSAIYRCSHRFEPLSAPFSESFIGFSYYGL
ncbi:hypothetical protein [Allocoleopsis sp.]|uniref:hypothetical protein n=1 Tax=Allocoleopsis sp. TaxID=3088169 RepID=UPI002FD0492E